MSSLDADARPGPLDAITGAWEEGRPRLSPEEARLLAELLERACGFVLREDLTFVAERRLSSRLGFLGLEGFGAYVRYLQFDPAGPEELETAVELLVPHETYFFREPAQLQCFQRELLPALLRANAARRSLRLWSAGCATGEEAYTLAMLVGPLEGWALDILGTDLSERALAVARRAEYGARSLRATSEDRRQACFEPLAAERVRVAAPFRAPVRFERLNLLDDTAAALLPRFDVIFCRNVLMYFEPRTRLQVVDRFFQHLTDGGCLLLGHSENLLTLSTRFELVQLEGDLVYRRAP